MIVALKAHSIPAVVDLMQPLLGNDTSIVTAVNGIPYWYFHQHGGALEGTTLDTIDPGGKQWTKLRPGAGDRLHRLSGDRGRRAGRHPARLRRQVPDRRAGGRAHRAGRALSALLTAAGLKAPVLDNIRDEIWLKLWGNLCFNPISALTHATLDVICRDPGTRAVAKAMMLEARRSPTRSASNSASTWSGGSTAPARSARTRPRCCRTSSAAGRWRSTRWSPAVQELGRLTGLPTPTIDTVLALVRQRAKIAGLH